MAPTGMPEASTVIERLIACLPSSTGFLPAFYALVMHPSTATYESSKEVSDRSPHCEP